jgi:hypothetical protein
MSSHLVSESQFDEQVYIPATISITTTIMGGGIGIICTGARKGNAHSELMLERGSFCFVPHTMYFYTRYSLAYQYRIKYLVFLLVEQIYYGTRKK